MSNFKIFVSQARTFKFGQDVDFRSLISYQKKNFGLGPPFGGGGAEVSNFKIFVSGARTFKFEQDVDLKSLISYLKKNFGLGPPFGRRGPEVLKFYIGGKGTPKVTD